MGFPSAHFPYLFYSRLPVQPEDSRPVFMVGAVNVQIANNSETAPGNSASELN
jgi:hypothetical protein